MVKPLLVATAYKVIVSTRPCLVMPTAMIVMPWFFAKFASLVIHQLGWRLSVTITAISVATDRA